MRVRGTLSFWAEVDDLAAASDPRWDDVYFLAFQLVEGSSLLGGEMTVWPFGNTWLPGYAIDLPDGSGFIGYGIAEDPENDEPFIALLHLIWYD